MTIEAARSGHENLKRNGIRWVELLSRLPLIFTRWADAAAYIITLSKSPIIQPIMVPYIP